MKQTALMQLTESLEFGNRLLEWMKKSDQNGGENVFYQEFCLQEGWDRYSIWTLRQLYPDFNVLMQFAEEIQEVKLNKLALSTGKSTGASFLLKNLYGYGEKSTSESKPALFKRVINEQSINEASEVELREMVTYFTQEHN